MRIEIFNSILSIMKIPQYRGKNIHCLMDTLLASFYQERKIGHVREISDCVVGEKIPLQTPSPGPEPLLRP
jgi:beta-lactam-binding protein with PASTA domain